MLKPFVANNLKNIPHIKHGFFNRLDGVSKPPFDSLNVSLRVSDNIDDVYANRKIIRGYFEVSEDVYLTQIHSDVVVTASANSAPAETQEGDALITTQKNILLCVLTADCMPILLAHKTKPIIAAIHAGWKGLFAGIIESTLKELGENLENFIAAIGPCAHRLEIGLDVVDQAPLHIAKHIISNTLFTSKAAESILKNHGINDIEILAQNTLTDPTFFSYRREKLCGRQGSCIMLCRS